MGSENMFRKEETRWNISNRFSGNNKQNNNWSLMEYSWWMRWGRGTAGPALCLEQCSLCIHLQAWFIIWHIYDAFFDLISFFFFMAGFWSLGLHWIRTCLCFGSLTVRRCLANLYSVFFSLMNVFLFLANLWIMVDVHRGDQITGSFTNMEVPGETKGGFFFFPQRSLISSLFVFFAHLIAAVWTLLRENVYTRIDTWC